MKLIIITGRQNVPDRKSSTGWSSVPYARKIESIELAKEGESVWSGELRWTFGDPEGRFDAGWKGPHGIIITDRESETRIAGIRKKIASMEEAIRVAEEGHKSKEWDPVTQSWVTVRTTASDEEMAAGLDAMDGIEAARQELTSATVLKVDGSVYAAELAALREKQKAEKAKAAAAGDPAAMPPKIRDLISCLKGKGSIVVCEGKREIWFQAAFQGWNAGKSGLSDYWEILAPLAANHPKQEVRDWFSKN